VSAVWLCAPPGLGKAEDSVGLHPSGLIGRDVDLARVLGGHEIVVTAQVPIPSAVLRGCPWVRGIVIVGSTSDTLVDREVIGVAGLLSAWIRMDADHLRSEALVREEIAGMERRLRALDALAEGWEGT